MPMHVNSGKGDLRQKGGADITQWFSTGSECRVPPLGYSPSGLSLPMGKVVVTVLCSLEEYL